MTSLYLLPKSALMALLLLLAGAVLAQTACLVYGFFCFHYQRTDLRISLLDGLTLGHLLVLTYLIAMVIFHRGAGFFVIHPLVRLRWALFLAMTAMALLTKTRPWEVPLLAGLTLPRMEQLMGTGFPLVLTGVLLGWLTRALLRLGRFRRDTGLSAFSVKEAVDNMDFGILFCREGGEVLLCNRKMQDLMFCLTGTVYHSGREFYDCLQSGRVLPGCRHLEDGLLYRIPEGSVWLFSLRDMPVKRRRGRLLTAQNVTEFMEATDRLSEKNRELEQRNRELQDMLDNLEELCRTRQLLRAKSQVHDLLGQHISRILRCVREHEEPDALLLEYFADGLPRELREPRSQYSLEDLVQNFASLHVSIHTAGELPEEPELRKAFYEIAAESVTNAIRHGYATEINIEITVKRDIWQLRVTDNGLPKQEPVAEGGGLRGMRRRAEELGGSFAYETSPHFTSVTEIPEGGYE